MEPEAGQEWLIRYRSNGAMSEGRIIHIDDHSVTIEYGSLLSSRLRHNRAGIEFVKRLDKVFY